MKQKVGILLAEDVLRRAERRAFDDGRPRSDVIQEALERYLVERPVDPARRDAAYSLLCERPIKLAPKQFKAVLELDS